MLFTTPPLPITDHPADSQHKGGVRLGFRWIVLHHTGGTDSRDWLSTTSPLSDPVSTQRLITKTGENVKIVPDGEVAWTQGPAQVGRLPGARESLNNWALAIELENLGNGRDPYPAAQIDMCARQCIEWWGAYGFIPIVGHGWVQSNKNDPLNFPWADLYAALLRHLKAVI